ncbi:MAG: DUF4271 domain-containing protein [Pseudarcicella sp.]|nr:DUF4271 domain-containing protein [Pseudarcicella sp.]MBP6409563.1 DUF4271 domain-containing protein [Pseudarcicella sp.]
MQAKVVGPNDTYNLVHDFKEDWQIYNESYKSYLPYNIEANSQVESLSLRLDLKLYHGFSVIYRSEKENYLFINEKLYRFLPAKKWVLLDIDSLQRNLKQENVYFTFTGANLSSNNIEFYIASNAVEDKQVIKISDSLLKILPRNFSEFDNFSIIIMLFLLFFAALLKQNFNKFYIQYFNVKSLLTIQSRDDPYFFISPFDLKNLLFVLYVGLLVSYLVMIVFNQSNHDLPYYNYIKHDDTLLGIFIIYTKITLIVFLVFILKTLALYLFGNLFKIEKTINLHFYKIVQSSILVYIFFVVFTLFLEVFYENAFQYLSILLIFPIAISYILRIFLIFFSINKISKIDNLYLFSYLCIVELIPIVLLFRFTV